MLLVTLLVGGEKIPIISEEFDIKMLKIICKILKIIQIILIVHVIFNIISIFL